MDFFDINNIFFEIWGYPMSYLEFGATTAGFVFVVLEARAHILNWPAAILNAILLFILFYQVQLYPDMFLQVFFFLTSIIGWWRWANPKPGEEDIKMELKVSYMSAGQLIMLAGIGLIGTLLVGTFAKNLHELFPVLFNKPSAFPYLDSFVTVMSITTTFFMIQKKIESWIVWMVVDAIGTYMYFVKGVKFLSVQYLAYCFIASYGLWNWIREFKSYGNRTNKEILDSEA
ncbi:MAG TPA: nicotinamide riboside transporter PnuC [Cyclobacteriaceae bacterium]|nr:nicotinamide riboside transporter PnuC [Cyclobacteriaceae bacterium]